LPHAVEITISAEHAEYAENTLFRVFCVSGVDRP
jgi:hypothetical protein